MSDCVLGEIARYAYDYTINFDADASWGQYGFTNVAYDIERGFDYSNTEHSLYKSKPRLKSSFWVKGISNQDYFNNLIKSLIKTWNMIEADKKDKGGLIEYGEGFKNVQDTALGYDVFLSMGVNNEHERIPVINKDYKESTREGVKINFQAGKKSEIEGYSHWKYPNMQNSVRSYIEGLEQKIKKAKDDGHPYGRDFSEYIRYLKMNTRDLYLSNEYFEIRIPMRKIFDIQIPA